MTNLSTEGNEEKERLDTYFVVGQNNKCSTAGRFDNDGEEFCVDCTESGVPAAFGYADVVIALLTFEGLAIDVPEL